jgi:uncharacterized membrane protein YfcA
MNAMILTFCAGILAGAMNALAGGGSFVSLPALIAAGVPPVLANTSSTSRPAASPRTRARLSR